MSSRWNAKITKDVFRRNRFRRQHVGEGDPHTYTPRASFRYQWEETPAWEKAYVMGLWIIFGTFTTWTLWARLEVQPQDWGQSEATRRQQMRQEAKSLMEMPPPNGPNDEY